jgi:toxoflavin synthase
MALYDSFAEQYKKIEDTYVYKYVFEPSTKILLAGVKGNEVIDVGCGSGKVTRLIKKLGAKKVLGSDNSIKQLRIAREIETKNPQGILYVLDDLVEKELMRCDKADFVTGIFVMQYSNSVQELEIAFKNIYLRLKRGGKFIGIVPNSKTPEQTNPKYGITCSVEGNFDGAKRVFNLVENDKKILSIENKYYTKETYENSIKLAGFKKFKWVPLIVSKEGIEKFEVGFWDEFLDAPYVVGLVAEK